MFSLQKVQYKVKAPKGDVVYESTVRSCSADICESRNDFVNCSKDMLENPGCMRRYCCTEDMCNWAPRVDYKFTLISMFLTLVISMLMPR